MKKTIIAMTVAVLGTGCAIQEVNQIHGDIKATATSATQKAGEVAKPLIDRSASIIKDDSVWIPVKRIAKRPEVKDLDPALKRPFSINRTFFGINDVAERISILTSIPVHVAPDVSLQPASAAAPSANAAAMPVVPAQQGLPPAPNVGVGGFAQQPGMGMPSGNVVALSYSGTLAGFLDSAAARFGVSWEMRDGRIEFYRYVTKTFALSAVPGDVSSKSSMTATGGSSSTASSAGAGAGGGTDTGNVGAITGQNSISMDSVADLSVWKSIKSSVDVMLSAGGSVVVNPATGTLTVRDYPRNVETIGKFIEEQNAHLSKQVVINVRVLSVSLQNSHNYGINWSAVYNELSGKGVNFRFLSAAPLAAGVSTLTATLVGNDRRMSGSEAVVQALSTLGDVSTITSTTQVTLNNQPVPVRVGRQTAYLQSSASTSMANAGTTTTITPGVVTTGFAMNLLPHIQPDGKIMMQYNIDLSSLLRLVTVTSGDASIQTPEVDTRTFMQRLAMRSGETIVMSGFEQAEDSANSQGPGSAQNVLLGGALKGGRNKSTIVILMTANVVDKI